MKRPYLLLPAFVLGLGLAPLGCGGTPTTSAPPPPAGPPHATFPEGTERAAGEVDYGRPRDFTFPVANAGESPLELQLVHKSCDCADVRLPAGPIAPGKTEPVVVHWSPALGTSGPYTLAADLATNDPAAKSVRLTVAGRVKPLVHVFIEGRETNTYVDFGDEPIRPGATRVREVKVFSTERPEFDLDATSTQPGLDVSHKTPLQAGERLGDYDVRSGYTVEVRTTDKLPLGYVHADLNLALSKLGDAPPRTITVPVYAVVGNGVFTVSPAAFHFTKPTLTEGETAKVKLEFVDPADTRQVEVVRCEPNFVKADVDKVAPGRWLVTARLPKEANAETEKYQADAFMEGQVVLKVAGLPQPVAVRVKWIPLPKK